MLLTAICVSIRSGMHCEATRALKQSLLHSHRNNSRDCGRRSFLHRIVAELTKTERNPTTRFSVCGWLTARCRTILAALQCQHVDSQCKQRRDLPGKNPLHDHKPCATD